MTKCNLKKAKARWNNSDVVNRAAFLRASDFKDKEVKPTSLLAFQNLNDNVQNKICKAQAIFGF